MTQLSVNVPQRNEKVILVITSSDVVIIIVIGNLRNPLKDIVSVGAL